MVILFEKQTPTFAAGMNHKKMRDSIDFGTTDISLLFRKMFFPTLLGMVLSATMCIIDGIFVGRGIGSDALAAVNIVAPFFLLSTGIGLMFGVGASVVASIHLSQGKPKTARINITQAFTVSGMLMLLISGLTMAFRSRVAHLLGSSERLLPLVLEYMDWVVPFLVFNMLLGVGLFVIRLDGSPKYAMWCSAVATLINLVLDYLFVFPFGMGLTGAALATSLSLVAASGMIGCYMVFGTRLLRLYKPKFSRKSLLLTARNVGYMVKLGASALLSEAAIACMMLVGNYVFIRHLGEDGVAAYSVVCYCFPIAFMVNNAVAQSVQPILSFNYAAGNLGRVRQAFRLSLGVAFLCGTFACLVAMLGRSAVVGMFLNPDAVAYTIAVEGIPYFALGFVFFALNIVCIGYYQSVEQFRQATVFTLLRGFVAMTACFLLLPAIWGIKGIWLAVPASEFLTFAAIALYYRTGHGK